MSWLLLTKYSVFGYVQFLLSLIITVYLWSVKDASRPTRLLQYVFTTFTLVLGISFVFISNGMPNNMYLAIMLAALIAVGLLQISRFVYTFPVEDLERESKWVFRLLTPLLIVLPLLVIAVQKKIIMVPTGLLLLGGIIILCFVWLTIVYFRKLRQYQNADKEPLLRRARPFTYLLVLPVGLGLLTTLEILDIIPLRLVIVLAQVLVTLFLLLFVIIYTNHSPEPTTFMVKIVGTAWIFAMLIMAEMGTMHLQTVEDSLVQRRLNEIERVREILEREELERLPERILSVSRLDSPNKVETLLSRRSPEFPGLFEEVLHSRFEAPLLEAYHANKKVDLDSLKTVLLAGLQRTDLIRLQENYDVPGIAFENLQHAIYYLANGDAIFRVVYGYLDYPLTIHNVAKYILIYISAVTLFLTLVFPLLYRSSLVKPLNSLISGLREVHAGNLDVEVPIKSADEIGFLTRNFNEMVASIRSTRRALEASNRTLEEKVASRTEDLEKKNRDLEKAMGELQQMQEQLLLQKKMASIGQLVAGLAHEINNPVGAIRSAADVSRRCLEKLRENGQEVDSSRFIKILTDNNRVTSEASQRISELMDNLRNFSRLDEASLQNVDLRDCLDSTLNLVRSGLGEGIRFEKDYGEVPPVYCRPAQLNQAFMHVLRNAIDAVGNEGLIRIATEADLKEATVIIEDNGKGIPGEIQKDLFDFRFTRGNGRVRLGSGLSTTYQILQDHKGRINIDSTPGEGTTVRIFLPLRD